MNESMTISNEKELHDFLRGKQRAVVLFGKEGCLRCSIVETVIDGIKKEYPIIAFGFTKDTALAESRHIDTYPVLVFYENGAEVGRLIGSDKITRIKNILNLWFLKDW